MATKIKETKTQGTVTQEAETKPKMKTVFIPSDPLKTGIEHDQEFVSVNGRSIMVKTDENVEVEECFAEVIERVAKFRRAASQYATKQKATE